MTTSAPAPRVEAPDTSAMRAVIESIPAAAVVVDASDLLVFANRKALTLLGNPLSELVGRPLVGAFQAFLQRARAKGGFEQLQSELYYQGSWYVLQIFPLLTADGAQTRYTFVTATDVSKRKRREFAFIEEASGLEEATRIAQMGTFRIDWATGAVQWSPHMYVLHGLNAEMFKPGFGTYDALVHPGDAEFVRRSGEGLAKGEPSADIEYRIVRPDQAVRWMRLDSRVLFDSNGKPYASFGTCQDITESKTREDELRDLLRRNAILYEALESSLNGVAVLTTDGASMGVLYVNAAFERLTQHNSLSLNESGLRTLIPDTDAAAWQLLSDAVVQSVGGDFEVMLRRRDGAEFPARIEIAPVRDHPAQAATAFVVNLRDLTAEKQRAAVLLQSQKMEALGQLSGGVAHEINNLLQPVIALSDLGGDMLAKQPEKAREYFEVIGNSGRKAREVVRQVLTFARRDTLVASSLDVVPLVADALNLAVKGLPNRIDVVTDFSIARAMGLVNATQVSQVVLNLLRNASDAMNGIGTITVRLSRFTVDADAPAAEVATGSWIKLEVQDQGCGIDAVTLARVFEPFFTTKPVGKGTGLGLSVVYSIVDGWGGVVRLHSEVDRGTSAVIYIPEQDEYRDP
jgi:PAS domain S-box-containing protein